MGPRRRTDGPSAAQEAMAKFTIEKDIAQHIKRTVSLDFYPESCHRARLRSRETQFDERKGPTWHCIVGRNFGSFVTHGTCL